MEKIGWQVVGFKDTSVFIKKLPLLPFSVIKILRAKNLIPLERLKKYRPLLIKQQPFFWRSWKWEMGSGIKEVGSGKWDKSPLIPTKTIWIDLTKKEEQLLREMHQKTRYNLKKTQNSKLPPAPRLPPSLKLRQTGRRAGKTQNYNLKLKAQILGGEKVTSYQLRGFYELWRRNKPYNFLFRPSFKELKALVESFGKRCFFVFVNRPLDDVLLASVLILCSGNMAFYWHNCSSKEGKTRFAPTRCVWEAIREAKKRHLTIFDFEGIWDERFPWLNQGWQGFTRFKKGFGGKEVEFNQPLS